MNAADFAGRAAELLVERGKDRDQPNGERSMARCVDAFNAMTGHSLTTEDGWLFMVYLKHARMRGGNFRLDDYEDAVSYEALMAEEASTDESPDFEPAEASYMLEDVPGEERKQRLLNSVFLYRGQYTSLQDILDTEVNNR